MAKKKKVSPRKRISAALSQFLRKQNPAFKKASAVQVKRNAKTGGVTFTPVRTNISEGWYDATGFHPIRAAKDYDYSRAGEKRPRWSSVKAKHRIK